MKDLNPLIHKSMKTIEYTLVHAYAEAYVPREELEEDF